MRCLSQFAAMVLALAFSPSALVAQVESGPKAGSNLEPLKVVVATGNAVGQELDFTAERKEKSTIFAFVQAETWDRPVARFLSTLDQALAKDRVDVEIIAVWLTDDVAKSKEYLPIAQQSLKLLQTTLTVYPGDKGGPAGWMINTDAHITVVVVQEQKVTASVAFRSVNETDVPSVLKHLKAP